MLKPNHPASPDRRHESVRAALIAAAALAFLLLTCLLDGGVGVLPSRLLDQPRFAIANAWPGLLLAGVLLALTRRLLLSFGLAFLLQGLVYAANILKVQNLGTPLMPADFQMVGQLSNGGAHLLGGYLPHSAWPYLGLLAGVVVVAALWRYEPPLFARRTGGKRLAAGVVMTLALATVLVGTAPWGQIYNGRYLWLEPWSAASTRAHAGLVSSLVMFHINYGHGRRQADPQAAKALIAQSEPALHQYLQGDAPAAGGHPDLVVIQSESFFDPTIMRGYEHSDFTPNLKRLGAHGLSGPLHVPTFGGGTIRTEFEVLTGLSLRYFDGVQFPYLELTNKVMPGLVRALHSHGYSTTAIHGNDPSFWNRKTAFKAIGFDRFISQSSFPASAVNDGKYMADRGMTDEIMAQLKDTGAPQFLFAISIEAHGPYDVPPSDTAARDAIPVPAGITGKNKLELQNYLYHIEHADAELGRLAQLLAQRTRPTLLLFYGDHLPALSDSYAITGFVDGKDMLSEPGTWLLVDPKNPGPAQKQELASWMLPGKLMQRAGMRDDPYFALTQLYTPELAALTRAPGAPPVEESAAVQTIDSEMASVSLMRLKGHLAPLLPAPASSAIDTRYTGNHVLPAVAAGTRH